MKRAGADAWIRAGLIVLAALGLAVFLLPLGWTVLTALKSNAQYMRDPWALPDFALSNFGAVLANPDLPMGRFYLNSLLVSALSVFIATGLSASAGYALARFRFRGDTIVLALFLVGLMIPVHVTLIPLVQMLRKAVNLQGHTLTLVGPYVGFAMPVSVYIFRGFFLRMPRELEEAAIMDGAEVLDRFLWVALPVARPAIATVVVLNFVTMWNEYVFALALIDDPRHYTLPRAFDLFRQDYATNWPLFCVATLIGVIPALAFYAFCQRHVISGLTAGAVK